MTTHKKILGWVCALIFVSNCVWIFTEYKETFFVCLSGALLAVGFTLIAIWTKTGSIYTEEEKKKIPRFMNKERYNDNPQ